MEWCKLYASLQHDKDLRRAGERAIVLFVFGLCHITEEETDGFIADDVLTDFRLPGVEARAQALVNVGCWDRVSDGYVVPGWIPKQKELYAIMRKRARDADRQRRKRKESRDPSPDSRATRRGKVAPENREELPPSPPADAGGGCPRHSDKPHPNCRGCGTNARAVRKAAVVAAPDWCGACSPSRRLEAPDTGADLGPCPACHPSSVRAS